MFRRRRTAILVGVGLAVATIGVAGAVVAFERGDDDAERSSVAACRKSVSTPVPQPTAAQLATAGLDELPRAPNSARVDLVAPAFSTPTDVSNPLFPISELRSAILNGRVEGKPFRTETTLLPETRILEWSDGQCVEVLVSQYLAYLDGRIEEVALDHYAQDDDGNAWDLGEDVFNSEDGVIADTAGTWLAGKEGPAAMIMPADPQVGDAYRPENIAGLVFEEVTVKAVGETVDGPRGPVRGAITVRELHDDGTFEEKVFAPGYGEFFTGGGGEVEALALAVPTDAVAGGVPPQLEAVSAGADDIFETAGPGAWKKASRAVATMTAAWAGYRRTGQVPRRLAAPTSGALQALARAVAARDQAEARQAALNVSQAGLDLQLQYRPPTDVDLDRFDLWLRQLLLDARGRDQAAVIGDVATVEWIRDRIVRALDPTELTRLDTLLRELRTNAGDEDFEAASGTASELGELLKR